MIACEKAVIPDVRFNDDYDQYLREVVELVEMKYRDSLVLAGMSEAEEEDFRRRRWHRSFVARLREFLAEQEDDSVGALSLELALNEAEPRKDGFVFLVWIGPAARQWLRQQKKKLKAFFGDSYAAHINYL